MTNREFYNAVAATEGVSEEVRKFAVTAIAKIDERNEKRKVTQTPNQKENEALKERFIEYIATNGRKCAAEVATEFGVSPSKASSLLTQAVKTGVLDSEEVRVKGKGKHKEYFIPNTIEGEEA